MYSVQEKEKAIELYLKSGCNFAQVKRSLGYPRQEIFNKWYKQYKQDGYVKEYKRPYEHYTTQQKQKAVNTYFKFNRNLAKARRELGYPGVTLFKQWIDEKYPGARRTNKTRLNTERKKVLDAIDKSCQDLDTDIVKKIKRNTNSKSKLYNQCKTIIRKSKEEQVCKTENENLKAEIKKLQEQKEKLEDQIKDLAQKKYDIELDTAVQQAAYEIVKKVKGVNYKKLTNKQKTALVDTLKGGKFNFNNLLEKMELSRSTYYYNIKVLNSKSKYEHLIKDIKEIFNDNNQTWGYRRIWAYLKNRKDRPIAVSEKVVRRLMKENKLEVIYHKKRRRWSSYEGSISPAPKNLVKRNFCALKPNNLWLTDITQFNVGNYKCYLSALIDCFDGSVVSATIGKRPTQKLANDMLTQAIQTLTEKENPIIHSDRGGHYRWPQWINICDNANLVRSMSAKGYTPDNAACEGFFGRLKNEFFYYRDWEGVDFETFKDRLNAYIKYYNEKRIKQSLGWMSPMEYRRSLGLVS